MTIIGYARVSTDGQTLNAQQQALRGAGAERVFSETASGARTDRKELARALKALARGDTLLVTRLDRLARSTRDLLNIVDTVTKAGAGFRSLGDQWADTTTPHGRLMLTVLGGLTDAAMDELLTSANDLLAPIDDLMTLEGTDTGRLKRMVDLSYKLASGRGRARHHLYEREHGTAGTWRTLALTSNEKPLAELSRTYQRPQGATVRLIDVPVILRGNDIFDALNEASPARRGELLSQLVTACRNQHGSAMVALLENWLANPEEAKAAIDRHMLAFTAAVARFSDTDLSRDLARKFGLLFAAARFAKTAEVVDWSEERIEEALTRTYRAARDQLADDGKLLRDGCAILLRKLRTLPRTTRMAHAVGAENSRGYRYQTASHHHCWLRNEAFDRLFTRPQRELVERWLIQEGRLELAPSRRNGARGAEVKKQHPWLGDRENRVRAVHIIWPRRRNQSDC